MRFVVGFVINAYSAMSDVPHSFRRIDWSSVFYHEQGPTEQADMSAVQIETSCSLTAWATGCVWIAYLWPGLLCPAWHLIHLKPITSLLE